MDIEVQQAFLKKTYVPKYKEWAKGVNEMYRLYENDFASSIEEITCYHYRITCEKKTFDFYPLSGKMCSMSTIGMNKWITVPKGSLKNIIKSLLK